MTSEDRDPRPVDADRRPADAVFAVARACPSKKKHLPVWQETLLLLGIALVLAIVIKALFVQAFYIPSESMEPGLVKNDRILVEKPSYWFGDGPERGDVVVFKDPGGWLDAAEAAGPDQRRRQGAGQDRPLPLGRSPGEAGDRGRRRHRSRAATTKGRILVNGQAAQREGLRQARAAPTATAR